MCAAVKSCDGKRPTMIDYIWTLIVAALLFGYLLFALLKPERF